MVVSGENEAVHSFQFEQNALFSFFFFCFCNFATSVPNYSIAIVESKQKFRCSANLSTFRPNENVKIEEPKGENSNSTREYITFDYFATTVSNRLYLKKKRKRKSLFHKSANILSKGNKKKEGEL